MCRSHRRAALAAAILFLASTTPPLVAAQRSGRSFGQTRGGVWLTQLLLLQPVQDELKLTAEQKSQSAAINDKLRSDRRDLFQRVTRESGERGPQLDEMNRAAVAKLESVLAKPQFQRLREIQLQVNGAASLTDKIIAQTLKLSEKQQKQLAEIGEANAAAMRGVLENLPGATAQQRRDRLDRLRSDGEKKLLDVLSDEQRAQFGEMQGKKILLDLSLLFQDRS